jgi:molybdate transport system ATP-binding protein
VGRGAVALTLTARFRKRLADFTVDVDVAAAPGVTIVFGESGAGKSTLLRCVAGVSRPDDGRIAIGDHLVFDAASRIDVAPARRRVGFVFQQLALFPHMSAADNIAYGLARVPKADRRARIDAVARSFRIAHVLDRRPADISGGERQRVGLARSLVGDPEILLLDEPLSALDHATQSRIIEDLLRWNEARRIPVLYVTHSQREVFALGRRVLLLEAGRIVADGPPQEVMNAPAHERHAELIGYENVLDGVIATLRPEAGVMAVSLAGGAAQLETPLVDGRVGDAVLVAVRAGDILLAAHRPSGLSARNVVRATIESLRRTGAFVAVFASCGAVLEAHVTQSACQELGLREGGEVWLVIKTHSCRAIVPV